MPSVPSTRRALTIYGALLAMVLSLLVFDTAPSWSGPKAYALRFATQPADAQKGMVITSEVGNPAGVPVMVEVIDRRGRVVTDSTALVTLTLLNAPGATLTGGQVNAVGGVAMFRDLESDKEGEDYRLAASSPGLVGDTSIAFDIWDQIIDCSESCSGSESNTTGELVSTVTASPRRGAKVFLSVDAVESLSCGDSSNHAPSVTSIDATGFQRNATKTVELLIAKSYDQKLPNNGPPFYDVCYSSPNAFDTKDGTPAVLQRDGEYRGLLPDCTPTTEAEQPCVQSRVKTLGGDVLITVRVPAADPRMT